MSLFESAKALGTRWNKIGRDHAVRMSERIASFHEGATSGTKLDPDPRDQKIASRVVAEVQRFNAQGRWQDARALFDPAHEPLIPLLDKLGNTLPCAVILGRDEFLVRTGTAYAPGRTLHLTSDGAKELPSILACAASRDHNALLLASEEGFTTTRGLFGPKIAHFPWPEGPPQQVDSLCVANDGCRIAFADERLGMWLGTLTPSGPIWVAISAAEADSNVPPDEMWSDSMMHCALSPDGQTLATGSQCYDHTIDFVGNDGSVKRVAVLSPMSSYPHNACFSDDGRIVALNSCHLYNGATFVAELPQEAVCEEPKTDRREINGYLRVYASTWLPANVVGEGVGAFVLCGSGVMTCVTPGGRVLFEQLFGSSAGAVDYSPETSQLIVSSYSGFVHVYDIASRESEGLAIGYNARRELYRWVIWKDHDPFRW